MSGLRHNSNWIINLHLCTNPLQHWQFSTLSCGIGNLFLPESRANSYRGKLESIKFMWSWSRGDKDGETNVEQMKAVQKDVCKTEHRSVVLSAFVLCLNIKLEKMLKIICKYPRYKFGHYIWFTEKSRHYFSLTQSPLVMSYPGLCARLLTCWRGLSLNSLCPFNFH